MAIWLIRAGSHGEYEQKFIQENRVYVTWDGLDVNLIKLAERSELVTALTQRNPDTGATPGEHRGSRRLVSREQPRGSLR